MCHTIPQAMKRIEKTKQIGDIRSQFSVCLSVAAVQVIKYQAQIRRQVKQQKQINANVCRSLCNFVEKVFQFQKHKHTKNNTNERYNLDQFAKKRQRAVQDIS